MFISLAHNADLKESLTCDELEGAVIRLIHASAVLGMPIYDDVGQLSPSCGASLSLLISLLMVSNPIRVSELIP
jgi:hypothetical protein